MFSTSVFDDRMQPGLKTSPSRTKIFFSAMVTKKACPLHLLFLGEHDDNEMLPHGLLPD